MPKFSDIRFSMLQIDNVFRELRVPGVGSESKQTEAFSKEEEDQLWTSGALAMDTPKGLLRAVFFFKWEEFLSLQWNRASTAKDFPDTACSRPSEICLY